MVPDTRETPGASPLQPLNFPEPVEVTSNRRGKPTAVTLNGKKVRVASVEDVWEVSDEWWRERPVDRVYYRLNLEGGRRVTVFRDGVDGSWYRQNV